jgi:hypothetical protein
MEIIGEKYQNVLKKKRLSHDNHNLNVNLKSNTMKNTVQR